MHNLGLLTGVVSALALAGCQISSSENAADSAQNYVQLENADWSKDATLYQINTRQFTSEGTFAAAEKELPRLKKLGVKILWLMPVHPIGEKNRKGTLGSPYSVKDYMAVNPEFGSVDDLKSFVKAAHDQDMKVILDWVANHTAWDHAFVTEHPDWYEKDWKGDFRPTPWQDWSDIVDLDWSKQGVRDHMMDAMEYWVRDVGIDGYRADVAGFIPIGFWEELRGRLEKIKPVFMLAEWKMPEMHRKAFDASYGWDWHNTAHAIAKGEANATALYGYYGENESSWPREAMRMGYIENHDSNSWDGGQYAAFGEALPTMIAFSFLQEGLPLIHNGQEACNRKSLEFFEKDPIDWSQSENCNLAQLFPKLVAFKKANRALWNGKWGGRMVKLENSKPDQLFSFVREAEGNKVIGLFNLSPQPVEAEITSALADGEYTDFANDDKITLKKGGKVTLPAWGWLAYRNQTQ